MGARNNDIGLKLAKANRAGFFPDIADSEIDILELEARRLFGSDSALKGENSALTKLHAAFAQSDSKAVNIMFAGSSSVAGNNATMPAKNFVNRTTAAIQAAYPSGLVEKTMLDWAAAIPATVGIQGFNAGVGSTTSANYLGSAPDSWQYLKFADVKPVGIFHMVGSNDWSAQIISPTQYKSNLSASMQAIDSKYTTPHVHILLHAYKRTDSPGATKWGYDLYANAMRELAEESPDTTIFIDIERIGLINDSTGTDPINLLDTDNIHPTDVGHALIADTIIRELKLRPVTSSTSAATAEVILSRARLTSDSFTGGNAVDINARVTDVALGGTAKTWISEPANLVAINNGVLVKGAGATASFSAMLPETSMNIEVGFTVVGTISGDSLICDIHRAAAPVAGNPNAYRIEFQAGVMLLKKRIGNISTTLQGGGSYSIGDRITFRYFNTKLEVRKNGVLMLSAVDTVITTVGFCGFTSGSVITAFNIDDFTVDALSY